MFSLTMTYFHEGGPHYHRRMCVSRSCSGREGVVPHSYGRQTLTCCLRCWQAKGGRSELCDCLVIVLMTRESSSFCFEGYRIKPHGQLVSVS